jgi:hypothetical protein
MRNKKLWKMANGEKIRIADMDDRHLQNVIALVERRFDSWRANLDSLMDMFDDDGFLPWDDADIEDVIPIYKDLTDERARRKLDPLHMARRVFEPIGKMQTSKPKKSSGVKLREMVNVLFDRISRRRIATVNGKGKKCT